MNGLIPDKYFSGSMINPLDTEQGNVQNSVHFSYILIKKLRNFNQKNN